MKQKTIVLLEDDEHIRQLVKYNLEKNNYSCITFSEGVELLNYKGLTNVSLFILDIMLPGEIDGIEVCRKLKENSKTKEIPVIFLTAKSEEFDTVLGLEMGADDYIKKPFGIRELMARIKVILKRDKNKENVNTKLIYKNIILDTERHEVYKDGELIFLPLKEYQLLKILMQNKGKVLSRDILLEKVWGFEYLGETRTVDVHIRYLRQKIEKDDNRPEYILTVRGIGYKFSDKQI